MVNIMKRYFVCFYLLWFCLPTMASAAPDSIKIGLLLIEDSVPFYIAEQEGHFRQEQLEVELIPFLSALERDSALMAGALDGAISDPVGAILLDRGQGMLKITSLGLGKTPAEGVFAILAAPGSGIEQINDLKNQQIAVSNGTIIEYVTDRLLAEQGFNETEIRKIEVKKMPIRMQMLLSGSVKAATLPEPLASIAAGKGAKILVSDADAATSLSQTVIIFRSDVLNQRKEEVRALFRAYGRAVSAINADPEKYRSLVVEKGRIPPFMAAIYPIAVYPMPEPFSKALFDPVAKWLVAKQLISKTDYESMVAVDAMSSD
jgi:NitT/TauT family transport system substrate-binding protein